MVDILKHSEGLAAMIDVLWLISFFFNFTTIIKLDTNFAYIFAGSVSEDYRKERLPSTSVGSLHHTEWRYVRQL